MSQPTLHLGSTRGTRPDTSSGAGRPAQFSVALAMSLALIATVGLGLAWTWGLDENSGPTDTTTARHSEPSATTITGQAPPTEAGARDTAASPGSLGAGRSASTYRVRPGDTLSGIAALHGTGLSELLAHNGIDRDYALMPDDRLEIPFPTGGHREAPEVTAPGAAEVHRSITHWSAEYGLSPHLVSALTWTESRWRQDARSTAGAIGVGQLLPATAAWVAAELIEEPLDPLRTDDNIRLSSRLLQWLIERFNGDQAAALAAYYQGPASIERSGWSAGTETYVAEVFRRRWDFRAAA